MAVKTQQVRVVCAGCNRPFMAKSSRAKWCSPTCRKRADRARGADKPAAVPGDVDGAELVKVVRAELVDHRAQGTVDGMLAVHLAKAVVLAERKGGTGPVDRLRTILAAATGRQLANPKSSAGAAKPDDEQPAAEPDALDEIRKRRDERARAAAG